MLGLNIEFENTPKKEVKEIVFNDIKPGTVFEYEDGTVALKLQYNEAALLALENGTWFELALGYKAKPIVKILGTLTGITIKGKI